MNELEDGLFEDDLEINALVAHKPCRRCGLPVGTDSMVLNIRVRGVLSSGVFCSKCSPGAMMGVFSLMDNKPPINKPLVLNRAQRRAKGKGK